jgi:M6 family metalloprotease-like protein
MNKVRFSFLLLFFQLSYLLFSALIINQKMEIIQPDGSIISCYASGDEFFNYLHDENGFTIIQAEDGYFYWAFESLGEVLPGPYRVDAVNPKAMNLRPYARISRELYEKRRKFYTDGYDQSLSRAPHTGEMNNLVVYIRFSNDTEFTIPRSTYDANFNAVNNISVYHYFQEVSYQELELTSTHYPITAMHTNLSYQDSNSRNYFQPYNATTNPNGYQNDTQRRTREHTLLLNAVSFIENEVPAGLLIDADGDGYVDNVSFIIRGNSGGWAELLWAHRWVLYSYDVRIHGKRVWDYTFQPENQCDTYVLCHELFHALGAPDLYRYYEEGTPVGPWDLMSSGFVHMGAWLKYKYADGNWINNIPTISQSGTYTLNPLTSPTNNAYKILSPNSSNEFFIVEYRKAEGFYEVNLPGSGLLVYRIHSSYNGNADGPPDEVYIYRPNGTTNNDGLPNSAHFGAHVNRIIINDTTNPSSFLTNGNPGGLSIDLVGEPGETISFVLNPEDGIPNPQSFVSLPVSTSQINLNWTKNTDNNNVMIVWSLDGIIGIPSNGTVYNAGSTLSGGGTVLYRGAATAYNHTNLTEATSYFYRAFSYHATNDYSPGINTNASTLCNVFEELPFTEDFNASTSLPSCWEITDNQGNGQVWQFGTHTNGLTSTTGNYAYLNSDAYGSGNTQNTDLITPLLDLSLFSEVTLTFTHYFRAYSGSSGTLSYSINNGSTWTTIQNWTISTTNPATFNQVIPALNGQSQVKLKWNYIGTWGWYWDIDDISLSGNVNLYADFTSDKIEANIGETVTFTDASGGGEIANYDWNFGEGANPATANSQGPHQVYYSTVGAKTVSLTINNSVTNSKTDYISVTHPPVAIISPNLFLITLQPDASGIETLSVLNEGGEILTYEASVSYLSRNRTELINEPFNTFPPTGWSTSGGANWQGSNTTLAGGTAPEARFYWNPSTIAIQRLISPQIDTNGATNVILLFKHYVSHYVDTYNLRVETSSDGITWNTITTYPAADMSATNAIISISNSDIGSSTFQIAFVFDGNSYYINNWNIDDVVLSADFGPSYTWLSLNGQPDVSGHVEPGTSADITVNFNTFGLEFGVYHAHISVTTNDPNQLLIQIPVSLTVDDTPAIYPPVNLTADVINKDVHLTWDEPVIPDIHILHYDNSQNAESIGTNGIADLTAAIRFEPSQIATFDGYFLTRVDFFPREVNCFYSVRVWQGDNASTLLINQTVLSPAINEWNSVTLATPVAINASQELWFGYHAETQTGYPLGCDAGPAVAGYGDMLYYEDSWHSIFNSYGLNFNWNIQGQISSVAKGSTAIPLAINRTESRVDFSLSHSQNKNLLKSGLLPPPVHPKLNRHFVQYNIYRDSDFIGFANQEFFIDENLSTGTYLYTVTALYTAGESEPAGPAEATVLPFPPSITLNTQQLDFGTLNVLEYTSQQLTISNTGEQTLSGQINTIEGFWVFERSRNYESRKTNKLNSADFTIQPNIIKIFDIYFYPETNGAFDGQITIASNDIVNPVIFLQVTGTGIFPASIYLSQNEMHFGNVHVLDYRMMPLTISNLSEDEILSGTIETELGFWVLPETKENLRQNSADFSILPLQAVNYNVYFYPEQAGSFNQNVHISSNDPAKPEIFILTTGFGTLPPPQVTYVYRNINNQLVIMWDAVPCADYYQIYSCSDYEGEYLLDESGTFSGTTWSTLLPRESRNYLKKFFKVTAISNLEKNKNLDDKQVEKKKE